MKGLKVPLGKAQETKNLLIEKKLLEKERVPFKNGKSMFFPLKEDSQIPGSLKNYKLVDEEFKKRDKTGTLKEMLDEALTEKERDALKTSFDVVGSIAILEVEDELEKKQKILAEALMKMHPRIKTVLKKEGSHEGVFRKQKMKFIAGEDTRETVHRENSIKLKINVETVYFSGRLSRERKRIAEMVTQGEKVLVMFSGAGPYVCVIAKNSQAEEIVGVEINPEGHKYAMENLLLNKIENARLYLGDVRQIVPEIREKFDRIIMPLPKTGKEFLPTALSAAKKGTIIHFYDFVEEKDIPDESESKIEKACKKAGRDFRILQTVKCGQHAPRVWRVCVDFEIIS